MRIRFSPPSPGAFEAASGLGLPGWRFPAPVDAESTRGFRMESVRSTNRKLRFWRWLFTVRFIVVRRISCLSRDGYLFIRSDASSRPSCTSGYRGGDIFHPDPVHRRWRSTGRIWRWRDRRWETFSYRWTQMHTDMAAAIRVRLYPQLYMRSWRLRRANLIAKSLRRLRVIDALSDFSDGHFSSVWAKPIFAARPVKTELGIKLLELHSPRGDVLRWLKFRIRKAIACVENFYDDVSAIAPHALFEDLSSVIVLSESKVRLLLKCQQILGPEIGHAEKRRPI